MLNILTDIFELMCLSAFVAAILLISIAIGGA